MKKFAVIVAAGTGTRMGSAIPKQFMILNEKPLLYYSVKTFLDAYDDLKIILVLPVAYMDQGYEIIDAYFDKDRITVTAGGDSRFQSVKNGLRQVDEDSIVFVHDAVRCLLTPDLIHRCYQSAEKTGTAIPIVMSKDSVRLINEEGNEVIDRTRIALVQTPQTFHSKILIPAYQIDYKDKFTDEASVVEAYGLKVSLVEGEETNIKITTAFDLVIAESILQQKVTANNQ